MTLSYHNDPAVKARHVKLARAHRDADRLRTGAYYWAPGEETPGPDGVVRKWRGCSVGCFAHDYRIANHGDHEALAEHVGLPLWLVCVQDYAFEHLPAGAGAAWHVALAEAVPVGADLTQVRDRWLLWIRSDHEYGALQYARTKCSREAVERVIALYRRQVAADPTSAAAYAATAYAVDAGAVYAADAAYARQSWWTAATAELLRLLRDAGEVKP